jgi:hypothetical protein
MYSLFESLITESVAGRQAHSNHFKLDNAGRNVEIEAFVFLQIIDDLV